MCACVCVYISMYFVLLMCSFSRSIFVEKKEEKNAAERQRAERRSSSASCATSLVSFRGRAASLTAMVNAPNLSLSFSISGKRGKGHFFLNHQHLTTLALPWLCVFSDSQTCVFVNSNSFF